MLRRLILSGLTLGMMATAMKATSGSDGELLVVNQGDRTVSVVNTTTGRIIAAIPVGGITGHEVAITPDGRTAFVPIYGDSGVGRPGTDGSVMAVIDVEHRQLAGKVDFGHGVRPHHPVYDNKSHLLYVTTELDKSVTVVDPRALKVVGAIGTGESESHMLAITHDGRRGYTANVGSGTVSVLDLEQRTLLTVIPVAATVQRIAISRDDHLVFTSDQTKPSLAVIDTGTNKVIRNITLPGVGYGSATTPDGHYLVVALREDGRVAVVDLHAMSVVRTFEVGKGPVEVLITPNGRTAYVSCSPEAAVAEVAISGDVAGWHVTRKLPAGVGADGLAWVNR